MSQSFSGRALGGNLKPEKSGQTWGCDIKENFGGISVCGNYNLR
jgi:hypothetical protein